MFLPIYLSLFFAGDIFYFSAKLTECVITFEPYMISYDMHDIWSVNDHNFNDVAIDIFQYQAKRNATYAQYLSLIGCIPASINRYEDIPFLPISFFKTHKVTTDTFQPEHIFESSTTTSNIPSKNYIKSIDDYHQNCLKIIESHIDNINDCEIFGLLPNYLERDHSSLVSMVQYLMNHNQQVHHFYLYDFEKLHQKLQETQKKKILFGVSFALMDFAEQFQLNDPDLTIIETGGMKGRAEEITKQALYQHIQRSFKQSRIMSEYGMTELMSQAYADKQHIYTAPPWMKVLPRSEKDPFSTQVNGQTAALNIIDLANIHSCCFIATDDLGKVYDDGRFEVTGRIDQSDIRGCSLMAN